MTTLTAPQIAGYASAAGFSGDALGYAVAIALAESGGRTDVQGAQAADGTAGFGLWQIEGGPSGPSGGNVAGGDWSDPSWNAAKAYAMSSGGTNFQPWCTAVAPMPGITTTGCNGNGSGNARNFLTAGAAAANNPATTTAATDTAQTSSTSSKSASSKSGKGDDSTDVPDAGSFLGALQAHLQPTVGILDVSGDITLVITRWVGMSLGGGIIVVGVLALFDAGYRAVKGKGAVGAAKDAGLEHARRKGGDHMKRAATKHRKPGVKAKPKVDPKSLVTPKPSIPASSRVKAPASAAETVAKKSAVSEIAEAGGVLA